MNTAFEWLRRNGLAVVVVSSLPAIAYVGSAMTPSRTGTMFLTTRFDAAAIRAENGPSAGETLPPDRRRSADMPALVKGIYVTSETAANKDRFAHLVDLVGKTELNAMVIDVKDSNGSLAFAPSSEELRRHASRKPELGVLSEFTAPLREKDIWLIARIFVFQDPALVKLRPDLAVGRVGGGIWRDRKGVPWVDPSSAEAWKYAADVAKEAYDGGFDEVQFDYIRFPSDGNLQSIVYSNYDRKKPKAEVMNDFFAYLDEELRQKRGIPTSVDLFGLVMMQHEYDLGIGQRLEHGLRHFDAVSPMVYPSHYADGFNGYANPAAHPYEVVRDNMRRGKALRDSLTVPPHVGTLRPWIQDFDLGAVYTTAMVKAQMKAAIEEGGSGWLLWNAKNVYKEGALELEEKD